IGSLEWSILTNNQISCGGTGAAGIVVFPSSAANTTLYASAQGNDPHNCQVGVRGLVNARTTASNPFLDLGRAPPHLILGSSLGDNNFRGIGAATGAQGPIVVQGQNPASALTISAKHDLFGGATPLSYTAPGLTNVKVDTSAALTGNAAFVAALYNDF